MRLHERLDLVGHPFPHDEEIRDEDYHHYRLQRVVCKLLHLHRDSLLCFTEIRMWSWITSLKTQEGGIITSEF
jgi:hypothetical protein